jgi:NAD(P)-dependent dehydrogenase (short-subunit alcohol dehydrogenase family)
MKLAIITGAGSGIGRATSILLAKSGYQVVLAGRTITSLNQTIDILGDFGKYCLPVVTDVSDPKSVRNLFQIVMEKFGRLDLLFNNAGIGIPAEALEDVRFEKWKQVIDINVTGSFLCIQEAFKLMKRQKPQGGRIINNGSISAHVPRPHSAPYTASKHAVTGLTKSASLDGRGYNICVGQIDIGNASTPMAEKMTKGVPQADGSIKVEPTFDVDLVARTILHMDSMPLNANMPFITIMANQMPYIGRG